jgi:hypothetical protein
LNDPNASNCAKCGQPLRWQQPQTQSRPPATPIKNWLVESILATLFCCTIPGIVGIVYAAKVDGLVRAGDYATAEEASQKAKSWTTGAFIAGLCVWVIRGLIFVFTKK